MDAHARIVAVERSADVVALARRELGLDALGLELVIDDALAVLRSDPATYDLVIEDIFVDHDGAAAKPSWLPAPGLALAAARLRAGGVLVSNNIAEADASAEVLRELFEHVVCLEVSDSDNRVLLASHAPLDVDTLRQAIAGNDLLRRGAAGSSHMSKL
jgi:spermidine synthase